MSCGFKGKVLHQNFHIFTLSENQQNGQLIVYIPVSYLREQFPNCYSGYDETWAAPFPAAIL